MFDEDTTNLLGVQIHSGPGEAQEATVLSLVQGRKLLGRLQFISYASRTEAWAQYCQSGV